MENLEWNEIGHDSDNIIRIAHSGQDLYVEFKNESGYKYDNVPIEIFQRILNKECISKSKGRPSYGSTLHQLVKKAGYIPEQYK
ncbi:KTSC domain-containing protein [Lutibacter citreus]|uniref:KTSC domain-containing protein n=1 Tax=Lutibacter citreus TaxID=2138210 RepID=UPI000DBEA978|nr:KTSC domain-containing protein [Lutibacter citreus]